MNKKNEIERLAVGFRVMSPNLAHCDVFELMSEIGGGSAILYGMFLTIPKHHRQKRVKMAQSIAIALDRYAQAL